MSRSVGVGLAALIVLVALAAVFLSQSASHGHLSGAQRALVTVAPTSAHPPTVRPGGSATPAPTHPLVPPHPPAGPPVVAPIIGPQTPPLGLTPPAPPPAAPAAVLAVLPAIIPGPLDGIPTRRALALRRPLAIMIENYAPDSRPQTGLTAASVVFETLAEFGVTRFMAVYVEHDPPVVGPVRSARVYFDSWAAGWHAILAHAGGNADALHELWLLPGLVNLDEVATEVSLYDTGSPLFYRSTDRLPPHNLYVYPAQVRAHVAATGHWTVGGSPAVLAHKQPVPLAQRPASGSIDINFSYPAYAVHYDYDRTTNTYLRSMGGAPHTDAVSGQQISPANVVVFFAPVSDDPAADSAGAINVQTVGSGPADYFHDGVVQTIQWSKLSVIAPVEFRTPQGAPVRFNPGQTWIEVVPQGNAVTWVTP